MSILGYSSAYFLPQYWAKTPLYGEKIIPLLDYVLSTDYQHTDQLASAFYDISSKYKNPADLPIDKIEALIEESGYGYVRNLLGQDNDSLRLLVYTLVLIHQFKGSKKGLELVLQMLRSSSTTMSRTVVGNPTIDKNLFVSDFSVDDYILYSEFDVGINSFSLTFLIHTGDDFNQDQCIASVSDYGFYLGIDTSGRLELKIGQDSSGQRGWQTVDGETSFFSTRTLQKNSTYYIKLEFDGSEYNVRVSSDDENYAFYISVNSSIPTNIVEGGLYIGIDKSSYSAVKPFKGEISLATFIFSTISTKITEWFEEFPVGIENTFKIDTEIDASLANVDFFNNFAKFIERYVYPSLWAFMARIRLDSKVVFIPYVRQKVTYIASNIMSDYEKYNVKNEEEPEEHVPYEVVRNGNEHEDFMTHIEEP